MKKFLSLMTAAVLAVTLTGCAALKLSESEYKKQSAALIDEYLCAVFDSEMSEMTMDEFDEDELADLKEDFEKVLKEANKSLDKLEKLNPPEEMEDFHEDLLSIIEKTRDIEADMLEAMDSKTEEKFMERSEKINSSLEKLGNKISKLIEDEDNEWFLEELEDAEFMESSPIANMQKQAQVTSADMIAKAFRDAVMEWSMDLETNAGKIPYDTVITIEGRVKNHEWIGSVSAPGFETNRGENDEAVEQLKDKLENYFDFEEDISAVIWISDKHAVGCACSTDLSVTELKQMFTVDTFTNFSNHKWSGKIDGMTKQGDIVGTCPKLFSNNH